MKPDSRVDLYIAKAPPFAQPILAEVRKRVQQACPTVEETIKWNVPFFLLDGKLLASMAAFKKHVKAGVWSDGKGAFADVTSLAELASAKDFTQLVRAAATLIAGAPAGKAPAKKAPAKKAPAKKAPAKKAPAKKAPAKKAPAKKAPAKKAPAKKAPAKRAGAKK
jgi:DNA-binding protein HU-beta